LTKILGVGPVISGKLNENGVFTYRQIASWTDDEVQHYAEHFGFGDRIKREEWRKQARNLMA